jgi:hypothetical protein
MAETYEWSDDRRREYVRRAAGAALFKDNDYMTPRYSQPGGIELPRVAWKFFHTSFTEFVSANLFKFPNISDQKWQRLARAQFAIVDKELVDDAFKAKEVLAFVRRQQFVEASGQICQWLKDNGYCISADNPPGPISPVFPMVDPSNDGTPRAF